MRALPDVLQSSDRLFQVFSDGFEVLLNAPTLSQFILALFNATHDPFISTRWWPCIRDLYADMIRKYANEIAYPNKHENSDVTILRGLTKEGLDGLGTTIFNEAGYWRIQYSRARSFRPLGIGAKPVNSIYDPFNDSGFHYNKSFLQSERFWVGELLGKITSLFYNKFPFATLHALLIPEQGGRHPQYLLPEYHEWAWNVVEKVGEKIPGFGGGYNSRGAFASVNHLHFQTFHEPAGLPITKREWSHNGGDIPYPIGCWIFRSKKESWEWIYHCIRENIAFNLIYLPGSIFCIERKMQGTYKHERWTSGFAWYEYAGGMIALKAAHYSYLTRNPDVIPMEFAKTALPVHNEHTRMQ